MQTKLHEMLLRARQWLRLGRLLEHLHRLLLLLGQRQWLLFRAPRPWTHLQNRLYRAPLPSAHVQGGWQASLGGGGDSSFPLGFASLEALDSFPHGC